MREELYLAFLGKEGGEECVHLLFASAWDSSGPGLRGIYFGILFGRHSGTYLILVLIALIIVYRGTMNIRIKGLEQTQSRCARR